MFTSEFTTEDGTEVSFEWGYSRHDGLVLGKFTHYVDEDRSEVFDADDVSDAWRKKAEDVANRSLAVASSEGWRV